MLRKRFFTAPAAAVVALALGLGGALVTTTAASAHTGDLKATAVCNPATGQYDVTYTLALTQVPNGLSGSTKWRVGTSNFQGTPSNANGMDRGPIASTGNTTLTLGIVSIPGTSTSSPWVYAFTSWGSFSKGSDGRIDRLAGDCRVPDQNVPVQLTYLTDCAVDTTNTWRFRNPTSTPVTLSLSDGATHVATPGDSIYETPRSSTTLTATWGGPGTGIVAGHTVKASGVDEVSDRCAGPQPETKIENGEWSVVSTDCDTREITVTRTVTTTTYELIGNDWVGTPTASTETVTRDMTEAELDEYCPVDIEPQSLEVISEWAVSDTDCDTREVTETRTVTTTPYVLVNREWVLGQAVVTTEEQTRPMTEAELDRYCPIDEQPADKVERTEWVVSEADCDTREVTETRTVTTTPYVLVDREWVPGDSVVTTEEQTRPMTGDELDEYCPVDIEPAAVEVIGEWMLTDSDCDTTTVTESRTVSTTPYVLVDREWVAGETVETTEERVRAMTDAERTELCPEAPVTPVTPTDLPTLALTDPPTLALTGPSAAMGGLGIAGLVALMAGLGLVLLRRPQAVSEEN